MYKACIFDLDGTLTDTLESITYCVNAVLKELGLGQINHVQCKEFVGSGARYLIEKSLQAAGDENLTYIDQAMEAYIRIFKVNCMYRVKIYDGVQELLEKLKEQGMKLAVLSNKPHLQAIDVVEAFFGKELFLKVRGEQEGIPRKPDPAGAYLIAEEFGVKPEECLYIGDSDVDMRTGSAAGMTTVGVTWGFRSKEILLENGAKHIIDRAEELITIVQEKGVE